jgi:hypothetical protein
VAVAWPLDAVALGAVFGREQTVHVAVSQGRLTEKLMNEIERLSGISGRAMFEQAGA